MNATVLRILNRDAGCELRITLTKHSDVKVSILHSLNKKRDVRGGRQNRNKRKREGKGTVKVSRSANVRSNSCSVRDVTVYISSGLRRKRRVIPVLPPYPEERVPGLPCFPQPLDSLSLSGGVPCLDTSRSTLGRWGRHESGPF